MTWLSCARLAVSIHFLCAGLTAQQVYTISTLSGAFSDLRGYSGDGGPANLARLNRPEGLAFAPDGMLYIADTVNNVVRAVDPSGTIRTAAGDGQQGFGGDGGPAVKARLSLPQSVAVDLRGNLYIADSPNCRIRRVNRNGVIETWAGTGGCGDSGDGGSALKAQLDWPRAIVIDRNDILYFVQSKAVRAISPDGVIRSIARAAAGLERPFALALDPSGNLYVGDRGRDRVARINADGTLTELTGWAQREPALGAGFGGLFCMTFDLHGNLFVGSGSVFVLDKKGSISVLLSGSLGPTVPGADETRRIGDAGGFAINRNGDLYIADSYTNRILRLDRKGQTSIYAGLGGLSEESQGGSAKWARHRTLSAVAIGAQGDVLTVDSEMDRVCRYAMDGKFSTVAGKSRSFNEYTLFGAADGVNMGFPKKFGGDGGPAVLADLDSPAGIAIDALGAIYISDSQNNRIRKISRGGVIQTIAGTGQRGFTGDNGPGTEAALADPAGLALDASGNLYIADSGNHRIRQLTPDGLIKTVAGSGVKGDGGIGPAINMALNFPRGVALDRTGSLYIADAGNHRIRKLGASGILEIIAGSGKQDFSGDQGVAVKASLSEPEAVAVDLTGNVYIADSMNGRVRMISKDGIIHTIAGNGMRDFSDDTGPAIDRSVFLPNGVAVDERGRIYVTAFNRLRVLTPQASK